MALIDYALIYDSNSGTLKYGKLDRWSKPTGACKMYEALEGF